MMAVNPQIIKTYAIGDAQRNMYLVFQSARFSFILMLLLSVPIIIQTDAILSLWLTDVPNNTAAFIRLVLLQALIETMCLPLQTLNQASGRVKLYQLVAGGVLLLNFPISYLFLKLGYAPICVFYIALVVSFGALVARLLTLRYLISFNAIGFLSAVFIRSFIMCVFSIIGAEIFKRFIPEMVMGEWLILFFSFIWTSIVVYSIGLNRKERTVINIKLGAYAKKYLDNAYISR